MFVATTALVLWIPITFYVFKRHGVARAAITCFVAGLLLLPNYIGIKLPFFPEIDKIAMVNLAMLFAVWRQPSSRLNGKLEWWWYVATIGLAVSTFITGSLNKDPLFYGPVVIPGHTFKDTMNVVITALLYGPPASYLGMRCFRSEQDLRTILKVLAMAGLLYSIPILVELRLSPQIHRWIYGYGSPHEWGQTIRWGGYRPIVMMGHGLILSLFMLGPTIAATALARTGARVGRFGAGKVAWFLALMIVLCKSTGVWFYGLALPLIRWGKAKTMMRLAVVMVVLTCLYPTMRAREWLPIEGMLDLAGKLSDERRQSLEFRFDNEDILLAKAMLRPWFGWGSYGRNRVFSDEGIDICVTDGAWILTLGAYGFVGGAFAYMFAVMPILALSRRIPRIRDKQLRNQLAAVALMCAIMWFDNLPNAPGFLIAQFVGGGLCSISANLLRQQQKRPAAQEKLAPTPPTMEPGMAARTG
jgi:hypothetical protein